MADISIRHPHQKPIEAARQLAEAVAAELGAEFGIKYRWQGNTLMFERLGVSGQFEVSQTEVSIEINLGFLLKGLKTRVASEAQRMLNEKFD